jgi:hypothetical protein
MRKLLILSYLFFNLASYAQQDSLFVRYKDPAISPFEYLTDTFPYNTIDKRHFLIGTCIMPWTANQLSAMTYGIQFDKLTKTNCSNNGAEYPKEEYRINSIQQTDTSLVVDISIFENCGYDFICDIEVDSNNILHLIYYGYGEFYACKCCFGLRYHFIIGKLYAKEEREKIKGIMINNRKKSLITIN